MKARKPTNSDIWSATRGLGLMQKDDTALGRIRDTHAVSVMFASRVIVAAVDQVRALRAIMQKGKTP